jgi:hypothetical protein
MIGYLVWRIRGTINKTRSEVFWVARIAAEAHLGGALNSDSRCYKEGGEKKSQSHYWICLVQLDEPADEKERSEVVSVTYRRQFIY